MGALYKACSVSRVFGVLVVDAKDVKDATSLI